MLSPAEHKAIHRIVSLTWEKLSPAEQTRAAAHLTNLGIELPDPSAPTCGQCGDPIVVLTGRIPRAYCSNRCRQMAYRERRDAS